MNRIAPEMKILKACSLVLTALIIGCGQTEQAEQTNNDQPRELVPGVDIPLNPQGDIRPKKKELKRTTGLGLEAEAPPRRLVNTVGVIQPEVTKLLEQIDASRQEGPTLVAWVIDRSNSAPFHYWGHYSMKFENIFLLRFHHLTPNKYEPTVAGCLLFLGFPK